MNWLRLLRFGPFPRSALTRNAPFANPQQGVNYAIQNGAHLSRARVLFFRHNDMAHLEQLLAAQEEADRRDRCACCVGCAARSTACVFKVTCTDSPTLWARWAQNALT